MWQKKTKIGRNYCHQNWWYFCHLKTHQFYQITKIFTKIGDKKKQNRKELLSSELVTFLSLKNSPISSNHQNVHQNWWKFNRKFKSPKQSPKLVNILAKIHWKWMWSHTFETTLIFYKIVTNLGDSLQFLPIFVTFYRNL